VGAGRWEAGGGRRACEELAAGYAVGRYANGAPPNYEHLVRLLPGRNPAQLEHILETLARRTPYPVTPMARLPRLIAGNYRLARHSCW
jgi:hypothetical protein